MEKATNARKLYILESCGTSAYQPCLFHFYFWAGKLTGEKWWYPIPALLWSSAKLPETCMGSRKAPTHTLVNKEQVEHSMKGSCPLYTQTLLLPLLAEIKERLAKVSWSHSPKYDSKGPYLVCKGAAERSTHRDWSVALSVWSPRDQLVLSKRDDLVFNPLISS